MQLRLALLAALMPLVYRCEGAEVDPVAQRVVDLALAYVEAEAGEWHREAGRELLEAAVSQAAAPDASLAAVETEFLAGYRAALEAVVGRERKEAGEKVAGELGVVPVEKQEALRAAIEADLAARVDALIARLTEASLVRLGRESTFFEGVKGLLATACAEEEQPACQVRLLDSATIFLRMWAPQLKENELRRRLFARARLRREMRNVSKSILAKQETLLEIRQTIGELKRAIENGATDPHYAKTVRLFEDSATTKEAEIAVLRRKADRIRHRLQHTLSEEGHRHRRRERDDDSPSPKSRLDESPSSVRKDRDGSDKSASNSARRKDAEKNESSSPKRKDSEKSASPSPKREDADKKASVSPKKEDSEKSASPSPKKERSEKSASASPKKEVAEKSASASPKKESAEKNASASPKKEGAEKSASASPKRDGESKGDASSAKKEEAKEKDHAEKHEAEHGEKKETQVFEAPKVEPVVVAPTEGVPEVKEEAKIEEKPVEHAPAEVAKAEEAQPAAAPVAAEAHSSTTKIVVPAEQAASEEPKSPAKEEAKPAAAEEPAKEAVVVEAVAPAAVGEVAAPEHAAPAVTAEVKEAEEKIAEEVTALVQKKTALRIAANVGLARTMNHRWRQSNWVGASKI